MVTRVVLYAEGSAELGFAARPTCRPGHALESRTLGPAHELVRRCIEHVSSSMPDDVKFEAPLLCGGRHAVGSDLSDRRNLRQLLTWPDLSMRPDLAVLLVDHDGTPERRSTLRGLLSTPPLTSTWVLGIAIEEFEAWLVADIVALGNALGESIPQDKNPESLPPGRAKSTLLEHIGKRQLDEPKVRMQVAASCDIDRVSKECRAFEDFLTDLKHAVPNPRS